jgi:hypothetical protein
VVDKEEALGFSAVTEGRIVDIGSGLVSFKVMMDIAKGIKDLSDASARYSAVIELQEKILSAQAAQTELIQEVGRLEGEVASLKDWDTERQRYELKDIGQGCIAYALKEEMQSPEPEHYLCANCYAQRKKRFLQRLTKHVGRATAYVCHECRSELYVEGHPWPENGRR